VHEWAWPTAAQSEQGMDETAATPYPTLASDNGNAPTRTPSAVPVQQTPKMPSPSLPSMSVPSNWFQQQGTHMSHEGAPAATSGYNGHKYIKDRKDSRDKDYMRSNPFSSDKMLGMLGSDYA
jgi:hypothetical protein